MICANPDLVVERGERIIPCAGAMAAYYEQLGGEVRIAGKPHAPIYEAAWLRPRRCAVLSPRIAFSPSAMACRRM